MLLAHVRECFGYERMLRIEESEWRAKCTGVRTVVRYPALSTVRVCTVRTSAQKPLTSGFIGEEQT